MLKKICASKRDELSENSGNFITKHSPSNRLILTAVTSGFFPRRPEKITSTTRNSLKLDRTVFCRSTIWKPEKVWGHCWNRKITLNMHYTGKSVMLLQKKVGKLWELAAGIGHSVQGLATGCKVRGSNPGRGEISLSVQTVSKAHPASEFFLPGVRWAELCAYHPPLSSIGLRMVWSYTSISHCVCIGMSWGALYLLLLESYEIHKYHSLLREKCREFWH